MGKGLTERRRQNRCPYHINRPRSWEKVNVERNFRRKWGLRWGGSKVVSAEEKNMRGKGGSFPRRR